MTIRHYSGKKVQVENIYIASCNGGYQACGQVDGISYKIFFTRKISQKEAIKAMADKHIKNISL